MFVVKIGMREVKSKRGDVPHGYITVYLLILTLGYMWITLDYETIV
jgi:hypothetical protein